MARIIGLLILIMLLLLASMSGFAVKRFGENLCSDPRFICVKVKTGQSWEKLWPDEYQRQLVKRLNRINLQLYPGMIIAVPKDLNKLSLKDIAPFPVNIAPPGSKVIIVEPSALAWGAYNPQGVLQFWGPISAGRVYCPDIDESCRTVVGEFRIYRKEGGDCISKIFPVDKEGGAPMPYCMFFDGGYALHGSSEIPGYQASHGCVRLFTEDAKWLNESFIDLPNSSNGYHGTKVIIKPYNGEDEPE